MKIASRGEDRECRLLEDHRPRSLWIVEDLKNEETTFFKAAARMASKIQNIIYESDQILL